MTATSVNTTNLIFIMIDYSIIKLPDPAIVKAPNLSSASCIEAKSQSPTETNPDRYGTMISERSHSNRKSILQLLTRNVLF